MIKLLRKLYHSFCPNCGYDGYQSKCARCGYSGGPITQ